jgi:hypothetical protein
MRLGALVHALGDGAASPAVLRAHALGADGAPQVQYYCPNGGFLATNSKHSSAVGKPPCNIESSFLVFVFRNKN